MAGYFCRAVQGGVVGKGLRIPTDGRRTSWLFTRAVEKLNSGLPRTTSASGQNGI